MILRKWSAALILTMGLSAAALFPQNISAQTVETDSVQKTAASDTTAKESAEETTPEKPAPKTGAENSSQDITEGELTDADEEEDAASLIQGVSYERSVPQPSITLNKTSLSLERGKKYNLNAKVRYSKRKKILWTSSKKTVATINKNGIVTAKGKGKAVITARIKGTKVTAICTVKVKKYITMWVKTTGYCNCSRCAGPWAGCRTASGTRPKANRTIAVDKRLIKLGTKVKIGDEMYVAEDTGGAIKGKKIDIYYSSHRKAQAHGVKRQKAYIYY